MKKLFSIVMVVLLAVCLFVACNPEQPHVHELELVPAVAATCTTPGNTAYYKCSGCDLLFSDAEGQNEITLESTVVPAAHTTQSVAAVPATCEAAGVAAHYECTVCHKLFSDAAGTTEVTAESLAVAVLGHDYVAAYSEGVTTWTCSRDNSHTLPAVEGKVLVLVDGVYTGYNTLEAACNAVAENATATIIVNEDISVAETITVANKNLTIMNRDGANVTIQDAVTTHDTDTGSTSNQVARMFQINGTSAFVVSGNTTGSLKFQGAADGSAAHTECNRRVLFFIGATKTNLASGSVTLNDGVEVTGIASTGTTSFGVVVRGYGDVTINGGNYHDNTMAGNALFCVYGTTVINGGTFKDNTSTANSSSVVQNCGTLTVNGGLFDGNSQQYGVIVGATPSTTNIVGGTFSNNSSTHATAGAAIYTNSAATAVFNISGGTFTGNTLYDYYETSKGTINITGGSFVTNNGTYVNGVKQ